MPHEQNRVQDCVRAKCFELVGPNGCVVGRWSVEEDEPVLSLADQSGQPRIQLRVANNGSPSVRLFDQEGTLRLSAQFDEDDDGHYAVGLSVRDNTGAIRSRIGQDLEGQFAVSLLDGNAQLRAQVTLTNDDKPSIALHDNEGQIRATMLLDDNEPTLGFLDANGNAVASLCTDTNGDPRVIARNKRVGQVVWP